MITRERAVELVEALLAKEQREAVATYGTSPAVAVLGVEEHALGWLVFWQSVEYVRSRDLADMLVGHGPYLVDRQDGSVHHIPVVTFLNEDWAALYLRQCRGVRLPDPLLDAVRALLHSDGSLTAMRHLRRQAPVLTAAQARAYVAAVRDGGEPPEELADLVRTPEVNPPLAIETRAGPVR